MDYHNIYKKVESFVKELYEKNQTGNLLFHTLQHTENVVEHVKEIATQYQLDEKEQFILYTAAWFHDTGHLFTEPALHEIRSVELMKDFLAKYVTDEDVTRQIGDAILSTKMPRHPQGLLQEIICDADTYHVGTKDFRTTNKLLKKEYTLRNVPEPAGGWNRNALTFLESHQYYTQYCRDLLDRGKQKNINRLRKKLKMSKDDLPSTVVPSNLFGQTPAEKDKDGKQKNNLLSRGIQTMLRLTSDNHLELSNMADGKANILISVNSIIISVILSVLVRRLEVDTYLIIPTVIFLTFSVATIVLAILATRPKISQGVFSREDIMNRKTNLLFFGNFHKASFEEYEWGMSQLMRDQDYLYGTLIKDIHQLGVVLGRKYRLLRTSYTIFLYGIVAAVLAFSIAVIFF